MTMRKACAERYEKCSRNFAVRKSRGSTSSICSHRSVRGSSPLRAPFMYVAYRAPPKSVLTNGLATP